MLVLQRLRGVCLALAWPALLLALVTWMPEFFRQRAPVIDLAAAALALAGGLIAAGFSRWRLSNAFLLLALAGLAARDADLPAIMTLAPLLALGLLPWLREAGPTGPASLVSGTLVLLLAALWLRGGTPLALAERWLTTPVEWHGGALPPAALLGGLLWAAVLLRLLLRGQAMDIALAGALASTMPVLAGDTAGAGRVAATAGAVLALWTGLLLHAWRMAYLDTLTGLPNRRALEDALKALPGRWCLSMLDVDHFKKFNDKWGHDVGDQVLRRVATSLAAVGARGRAYRYGGEEFSVLFPHDDLERAGMAIERVREGIAATPFQVRGVRKGPEQRGKGRPDTGQRITVSAGLAAGNGPVEQVFKRADQALYKAKKQGRNRLVRADGSKGRQ